MVLKNPEAKWQDMANFPPGQFFYGNNVAAVIMPFWKQCLSQNPVELCLTLF